MEGDNFGVVGEALDHGDGDATSSPNTSPQRHGHDPAVSLSIYSDAQPDDLQAAGASPFD